MRSLVYELHVLVRALDRSAEVRLAPFGISYTRYLALLVIGGHEGMTQRDLAAALGQTEPTAGRTAAALADAGWLEVTRTPGGGNRRALSLTTAGRELLEAAGERLSSDFDDVVRGIGRNPDTLARDIRRITAIIEESR